MKAITVHVRRRGVRVLLCAALLGLASASGRLDEPSLATVATSAFPVVGHMYASDQVPTTVASNDSDAPTPTDLRWAFSQLLLDAKARRGYQVLSFATPGWQTEISVFDLDHLSLLRRVDIPGLQVSGLNDPSTHAYESFPAALRTGSRPALFLIAGTSVTTPGVNAGDLVTLDLTTMTISSMSIQPTVPACLDGGFPSACPIFGLAYDERSGLVWAYVAQSEVTAEGLVAYSFGAVAVDPVGQKVVAIAPLPSACNYTLFGGSGDNHEDQYPVFRSTDGGTLWTICVENVAGTGFVTAAVGIPLAPQGLPKPSGTPTVYAGVFGISDVYADAGGNRLVFRQVAAGDRSALIFDGPQGSFIGAAGLGSERFVNGAAVSNPYTASGVDPSTGRFYNMSDAGLFLVDGRRTDRQGFPQATVFAPPTHGWSGDRPVVVDPLTRHVFVLGCVSAVSAGTTLSGSGQACENTYTVYQDNVPVSTDVPLSGLDANTGNVPLVPGSTVAIYAAHAQGFGTRSYTYNPASILTGTGSSQPNPAGGVSDLIEAGATSVAGQGSGADLTNNGASAAGITADADSQSRQQFSKTNRPFPYSQVPCDDTSGTEAKAASTGDPNGSTQVDCNLTQGTASVTSAYRSSDAAGGALPSTSPAESDVAVTVSYAICPAAPVCNGIGSGPSAISTATATVHGIDLAAAVSISYLQIAATAVAGGRSGTAVTKYATTIRGVHAGAYDCSSSCDPTTALQQINAALAQELPGQVQVAFPPADATAAKGTPEGYFAAVEKDTYALLNDQTVSGDSRPELVGMEEIRDNAVLYNGSQAKQITEYGGVEVESRLGITALDLSSPTFGTGAITPGTSIPGTAGTAGQYVPASNASAGPGGGAAVPGKNATGPLAAIVNGLAWLLDWTQLPLMSLMWIVLLIPAYLATRRRRLEVLAL